MPRTVSLYKIEELAKTECKSEILLQAKTDTELHIIVKEEKTIVRLPFGNKFDIIDNCIIIYGK